MSVSFTPSGKTKFICRRGGGILRPVGGFCRKTTSSLRSSGCSGARLPSGRCSRGALGTGWGPAAGGTAGTTLSGRGEMLKVGRPPKAGSRKDRACSSPVRRWKDGL